MAEFDNKTCTRLEVQEGIGNTIVKKLLFVKSEWKPTRSEPTSFELAISDGLRAWRFEGSEMFVSERAEAWDKKVSWVMEKLKFYLTLGQPGVSYRFTKTRDDRRKLSFDIEDKESDLSLTASFVLLNESDPESVTCDLLGFLYDGNCRLTESYLKKCRTLNWATREKETVIEQTKRFEIEKNKIKDDLMKKFVAVLNTKKSKNREFKKEIEKLREQLKSKDIKEEDERDDTSTSSSEEEDDDEESDHQMSSPEIKRDEAFSERLVSGEEPPSEPVSTSGVNVVNADPDATQPFMDEIENEAPVVEPPKEDPPRLPALVGDAPYMGLRRKKRRN